MEMSTTKARTQFHLNERSSRQHGDREGGQALGKVKIGLEGASCPESKREQTLAHFQDEYVKVRRDQCPLSHDPPSLLQLLAPPTVLFFLVGGTEEGDLLCCLGWP